MTEQKMTVQQMLPNFVTLFKVGAIKRLIIYVDADMNALPHLTEDDGYLREALSFESKKDALHDGLEDEAKTRDALAHVLIPHLFSEVHTLLRSPLNNGVLGVFIVTPEGPVTKTESAFKDFLNVRAGDIWDMFNERRIQAQVKFFVDNDDAMRVEGYVGYDIEHLDLERQRFVDTVNAAIPEFSNKSRKVTSIIMKCVTENVYHVRYGFDYAAGKYLAYDEKIDEADFGVNFVAPDSDGSEFAPDSKFFIKPEDWKTLIPIPEQ